MPSGVLPRGDVRVSPAMDSGARTRRGRWTNCDVIRTGVQTWKPLAMDDRTGEIYLARAPYALAPDGASTRASRHHKRKDVLLMRLAPSHAFALAAALLAAVPTAAQNALVRGQVVDA